MSSLQGFSFQSQSGVAKQPTAPFTVDPTMSPNTLDVPQQPQQPQNQGFNFGAPGIGQQPADDQPGFELAFGFIPTLNVGNILGIENDVARTVTNIVADPFAWLPAIFSGGLTVGAKAASTAARLNSAKGILRLVSKGAGTGGRLLNTVNNIKKAQKAVVTSAKAMHAPKELLATASAAAKAGDTATYVKTMRQILKTDLPDDARKALDMTLDDLGNLKDLGKLETKLGKQFRHLEPGIRDKKIASILDESFLREDRIKQSLFGRTEEGIALGKGVSGIGKGKGLEQRSLLRIRKPFSPDDGKTLVHGDRLYRVMDSVMPLGLRTVGGGTAGAKLSDAILDKDNAVADSMDEIEGLAAGWRKEIEDTVPGALDEGFDDLIKFHTERKGVPKSELERLGLLDQVPTKGELFHGSSTPIRKLVDDKYTSGNIYGQGFYTTDAMDIAVGYTKKGSKAAIAGGAHKPSIYSVATKGTPNLYDMEKVIDPSLVSELRTQHPHLKWLLSPDNINESTTLRSVYDRIRSRSKQRLITVDKAQDMFGIFRVALEKRGFNGLHHTGGLLTNNAPHGVSIFFNPSKSLTIKHALKETDFKMLSTKGKSGTRIKDGIEILSRRDFEKFLENKGWLNAMNSSRSHVAEHLEILRKTAVDEGLDINFLEDYITHFWDIETDVAKTLAMKLKSSDIMLNKRKFQTFVEGMNNKHTPLFNSTFDTVKEYQKRIVTLIESRKIINRLKSENSKVWIDGQAVRMFENSATLNKLTAKGIDVKSSFVNLAKEDSASLEFLKKIGVVQAKRPITDLSKVWVPKQLANQLQVFYKAKSTHEVAASIDGFNAMSKIASLSFSLFHAGALTESAIASMGVKGIKDTAKLGFGIPGISQLFKKAGIAPQVSKEWAERAYRSGVAQGPASDAQISAMDNALDFMASKFDKAIPGLGLPFKGMKQGARFVNEALWTNFHEPLKLLNFEHQVGVLKKMPQFKGIPEKELLRVAAARTNDAFGGQNWQQLMVNPRMQQIMHWALLAPDWTISNARVAGVGTTGLKGLARGVIGKGRSPSEAIVGKYWRNALVGGYVSMNLLNRSLSGHYMWENPPGKQLDIDLGTTDEKGQPEFMKLGKQMREPFRWLTEPLKMGGAKLAPLNKEIVEQLSGRSPGSQFPTAFAADFNKKPTPLIEQIPSRVMHTLAKFKPYSLQGKNVFYMFPRSSLTPFKVEEALINTLERSKLKSLGRATGVLDKKSIEIRDILTIAKAANMDVNRIMGNVKRKIGDEAQILEMFKEQR